MNDVTDGQRPAVTSSNLPLATVGVAALLLLGLAQWRFPASAVVSRDVPDSIFSGERAFTLLESLLAEQLPHPAGSEQNEVVRERILDQLREWGYEPETQVTEREGVPLVNLMVRLGGTEGSGAVMLACHHDSVRQGPGAADDGAAVAALMEVMRMLKSQPPPKNDVILLITDGEEFGLLGAKQFVAEHPWAADVGVVMNFEARGTSGPSCMFETGEPNQGLVDRFAQHVPHPRTSSLFYEIYKLLPNDTDFTVFKAAGMNGLNFAFIGDVGNYHTPEDNLDQLDPRSLQHHGENAWAMTQALANADLPSVRAATDNAVYFDLFGGYVVRWPQTFTLPLAALASAMTFVALARLLKRFPPRSHVPVWYAFPACFFLVAVTTWLVLTGLKASTFLDSGWPPRGWAIELAVASAALLSLLGLSFLCERESVQAVQSGIWIGFSVLAVVTAWLLPGASYFFIVPLLVGGGIGVALANTPFFNLGSSAWPVTVLAMCLPVERLFYDAMGFTSAPLVAVRFAIMGTACFPCLVWASSRFRAVLIAICMGGFVGGLLYVRLA